MAENFTFNVVVVVGRGPTPKYIPARGKVDTGCKYNLVSADLLARAPADRVPLDSINADWGFTFEGVAGFTFVPEHMVELNWYREGSEKLRQDWFFVVEDAPFDLLVGTDQFVGDYRSGFLFLASRHKSRAQRREMEDLRNRNLAGARQQEQYQLQQYRGAPQNQNSGATGEWRWDPISGEWVWRSF